MAGSATVGILRALLTADTTAFDAAMAGASSKTKVWSQDFTKLGLSAQQVGSVIVNAMDRSTVSVDRLAKQFSGAGIAKAADEMAAAIGRIPNGALGLTANEQAKVNAVVTEAIEKYRKLGQEVPAHLQKLADQTKVVETQTVSFGERLKDIGSKALSAGTTLTAGLTVPIAGIAVASVKAAMDFESSFAGVKKTVDATKPELDAMAMAFRKLATEIPVSVNELNKIGEAAGALGIPKAEIVNFSKVMAELGVTTNLTADQAANAIARIQNIFGAAGKDTEQFASTLVALGNAGASTEAEIVSMAQRIAGAGHTVGLTQAQVLSFASSLSSVGIEAEAGGSAISRIFLKMNDAVMEGGNGLKEFARVAGVSAQEFKKSFEKDAAGAAVAFIGGLGRLKDEGENINQTIEGLVGKNIILKDTLFRLSGAGQLLTDQLALGNKAWKDNNALTEEARKRFETTDSQLKLLKNQVNEAAISLGSALLPMLNDAIKAAVPLVKTIAEAAKWFGELPEPVRLTALGMAGVVAAIGPALLAFGGMSRGLSSVIELYKLIVPASVAANVAMAETSVAATTLDTRLKTLAVNPIALALLGVAIAGMALKSELDKGTESLKKNYDAMLKQRDLLKAYQQVTGDTRAVQVDFTRMTEDQQAALLAMASETQKAGLSVGGLKLNLDQAAAAFDKASGPQKKHTAGTEDNAEASKKAAKAADAYAQSVRDMADAFTGKKLQAEILKVSEAVALAGKQGGLSAAEFEKLGKQTNEFIGQGGRLTPLLSDLHLKWLQLHPVVVTSDTDLINLNKTIGVTAVQLGQVPALVTTLVQSLARIPPVTIPIELGPPPATTSADYFDFAIKGAKEAFAKIPDILIASFTGGGDMAGALKAIGVQISAAIIEPLEKALSKVQKVAVGTGTTLATALGQSAGLGATTNTIIGVGTALAGTALAASAWGTSMAAAGVAGSVALGAATLGIGAAAVGIAMLIKHWKDHKKMVEENTKTINAFEQQMWQNLTAEQAIEANGRTWAATNISVRDAYLATGRSAAQAEADIARLHYAAGQGAAQTQAAINKINQAYIEQKQHTDALTAAGSKLDEAVKKYGFTIEELGPKFRAQQLTEQAQSLIEEYAVLTASGIDVGLVTEKMTENVNDYLHMALKTGVEVPEAMRPMLEKMLELGQLTDENGEKLDDLSDLTFGVTLTQGFQSVVDKLSELIHLLAGDLPTAADDAADDITERLGNLHFTVPVRFDVQMPDMPSFSGEDTNGIPIFPQAEGGDYLVTRPTLFLAGEAGPERATFSGAGNLTQRGTGGAPNGSGDLYFHHQTILAGQVIDERIEKVGREKLAQMKWPVPADAVRGRVPNG